MNERAKGRLIGLLAAGVVLIGSMWLFGNGMEPIEDTNGPDDYSLTTITDEQIIGGELGALNPVSVSSSEFDLGGVTVSSAVQFKSSDFSGVYEILYNNYILPSDFVLNLTSFTVDSGNFKMVVIHDDEIVATLEPGEFVEYCLEDVTGTVSLRIAGESASYCFYMSQTDYDTFAHP